MDHDYFYELSQISQSLASGSNLGVDVDVDHILLDGKFTVVSQENLGLVHGDDIPTEKFLTKTVRFPGTYHLFSGNMDNQVFKARDQHKDCCVSLISSCTTHADRLLASL